MMKEWTAEELSRGEELYRRFEEKYEDDDELDIDLLKQAVLCGCANAAGELTWFRAEDDTDVEEHVWDCCYQLIPEDVPTYELGNIYHNQKRYDLAVKWWRRAARDGSVWGQFNLGLQYAEGNGVAQDWGWALYWYQCAAKGGDDFAWCNLGKCYWDGKGVSKDEKKAYRLMKRASDAGNAIARLNLGYMYCFGECVRKNGKKAFRYYQEAMELGCSSAVNNLGYCYYWGIGCQKDDAKAVALFRRAIAEGDKDCAAYNLAYRYRMAEGAEKDYAQAWKYFRMAAAAGYSLAFKAMGDMALKGEGLPKKNPELARRYYHKAIKAGDGKNAHAALARCYEQGLGVRKNIRKAYEHIQKALEAGFNAKERLCKRIIAKWEKHES